MRATRGLRRLPGDTSGRASSTAATRRANATLDARARAWWLHGCSICAGTQMAGGDGPCRCRAPTRTRPTPTRKALPAARGVRPGCAWAYSAATITRHGSRAAILILGDSNWGRSFLDHTATPVSQNSSTLPGRDSQPTPSPASTQRAPAFALEACRARPPCARTSRPPTPLPARARSSRLLHEQRLDWRYLLTCK